MTTNKEVKTILFDRKTDRSGIFFSRMKKSLKSLIIQLRQTGKGKLKLRQSLIFLLLFSSIRFIARIEEILSEWKLNGPESSNNEVKKRRIEL